MSSNVRNSVRRRSVMRPDSAFSARSSMAMRVATSTLQIQNDTQKGLGIRMKGGKDRAQKDTGIFIKAINPDGAAGMDGRLLENDQILEINGQNLRTMTNDQAMEALRSASTQRVISLTIARILFDEEEGISRGNTPGGLSHSNTPSDADFSHLPHHVRSSHWGDENQPQRDSNNSTATTIKRTDITPIIEREIKLPTSPTGLGVSIQGGAGSPHGDAFRVKVIDPNGPVGRDGRIKSGDVLLAINGKKLTGLTSAEAMTLLQLAKAPTGEGVSGAIQSIDLPRDTTKSLGITVIADGDDIKIKGIMPGSAAEENGQLRPGMTLVGVDQHSLVGVSKSRAVTLLSMAKLRGQKPTTEIRVREGERKGEVVIKFGQTAGQISRSENVTREGAPQLHDRYPLHSLFQALRIDGAPPDDRQKTLIKNKLGLDASGKVAYGDFMDAAKVVIKQTTRTLPPTPRSNSSRTDVNLNDVTVSLDNSQDQSLSSRVSQLEQALNQARSENLRLQQEMVQIDEEAQELRNKIRHTESAARSSRTIEKDYDEVVALLEAEIAHLRAQLLASPSDKDKELVVLRQRVTVLSCQLNKAVQAKNSMDSVNDKLLKFVRRTVDRMWKAKNFPLNADKILNQRADGTLRHRPSDGPLPPSAPWAVGDVCRAPWLDGDGNYYTATINSMDPPSSSTDRDECVVKFLEYDSVPVMQTVKIQDLRPLEGTDFIVESARTGTLHDSADGSNLDAVAGFLSPNEQAIANDAQEVLELAMRLVERQVLPFGWEEAYTSDGARYFIDHTTKSTTWIHPASKIADVDRQAEVLPYIGESGQL